MYIKKRDGRKVPFDSTKITNAVLKAFKEVDGSVSDYAIEKAEHIAAYVEKQCLSEPDELTVEQIQDLVEKGLMATKRKDVAKAYILYRNKRSEARKTLIDEDVLSLVMGKNDEINRENSNKNATLVSTQRDYIAGITSKNIAKKYIFPKEAVEAHEAGIIHIHDMDYAAQHTLTNCELINLDDMLQNGTSINGIKIEKPHRLSTATTIATQVITAVASSSFGGATITLTHLAPFVRSSYERYLKKYSERGFNPATAEKFAKQDLKEEVKNSVQTFNYQINSMSTTNG